MENHHAWTWGERARVSLASALDSGEGRSHAVSGAGTWLTNGEGPTCRGSHGGCSGRLGREPERRRAGGRVDLWALTGGRLPQVTSMSLLSNGGGALFDQLVLGRTPEDLP